MPESLDLTPIKFHFESVNCIFNKFSDDYFKDLSGYNNLLLSNNFYQAFEDYEYILICQKDVFVFKDKLQYWMDKNYDYIGAPWVASKQIFLNCTLFRFKNIFRKRKKSTEHYFKVGNGGFSLRRTKIMQRAIQQRKERMEHAPCTLAHWNTQNLYIEDLFFSLVAPTLVDIKIPEYMEAIDFCIDRKPALVLKLNHGKLPFACHRFYDPKARKFWQTIINGLHAIDT